jgi:hypothetical protein
MKSGQEKPQPEPPARRGLSLRDDMVMGFRFLRMLPAHLRNPLTVTECKAILQRRLERRENDFLDLMRRAVWENRASPYHLLLQQAGCEYGDTERLVRQEGVEGALRALFRAGVYLTVDEYKGRRPVVRGSSTVAVNPRRLRNPLMTPHFWGMTSGSRGEATHIPLDLACIRDRAVNMYLALDSRGGERWRNAVWGMPGIGPLLWFSVCGAPAARWFSTLDPAAHGLHPRYRWSVRAITWTSRFAGVPVPSPEHVPLDAPLPIGQWMARTLEAGEVPHLWASSSSAVSLCRAAEEAGVNLAGARLTITGEPVTDARLAAIRRTGADAAPDYGSADSGGSVGYGCLSPEAPDDIHVFSDLNGLIQADGPPFPKGALLLSSIRPTVPFVFLNVSMGDCATVTDRRCGCPLEKLGWQTHLHTIRSYEKLTAAGMTFEDADVVSILEEALPRRFGGGPTDYQLVEEPADDGQPCLRLLVNPAIAAVDAEEVSDFFLETLGTGSGTRRVMALHWRHAGILRVERRAPLATSSGKILHIWAKPEP